MEQHTIQMREYRFPIILALFILVLGTLPYIYGYMNANEDDVFMGFVGRGTPGAHGYLMFGKQVADGNVFLENRMTPDRLPANYFNLEWWVWGNTARILGLSLMETFHFFRCLAVMVFILGTYFLASQCTTSIALRRIAVGLVCLGAGFGWIATLLNSYVGTHLQPLLDMKGVVIFGYLINKPHFIRAGICVVFTYAFLLKGVRTGQLRYYVLSGLAALTHSAIRPFHIPETFLLYALLPVLLMLREQTWKPRLWWGPFLAGLINLPGIAYYVWLSRTGALGISGWTPQPVHLLSYLIWLGVPFVCCVLAFLVVPWMKQFKDMHVETLFLALWALVAYALNESYPYWFAGWEGGFYAFQIGIPILFVTRLVPGAGAWLKERSDFVRKGSSLQWIALLCIITVPGTTLVYKTFFDTLKEPSNNLHTYYISKGLHESLLWLNDHANTSEVVMCSEPVGQFVPRFSDCKVIVGHIMLTTNYHIRNQEVGRFYRDQDDHAFKQSILDKHGVRFVLYSPFEKQIGAIAPENNPWLRPVFQAGDTTIYEYAPTG